MCGTLFKFESAENIRIHRIDDVRSDDWKVIVSVNKEITII